MAEFTFSNLRCAHCRKPLVFRAGQYFCSACGIAAKMIRGKPVFLTDKAFQDIATDLETGLLNRLKTFLRRYSAFYNALFYLLSPAIFFGRSPRAFLKLLPKEAMVVDIGSGSKKVDQRVVNVDICPWDNVSIVADAHDLPFLDQSVDAVITTWTIEHLKYPGKVVSEIRRILKPGGYLYLSTNFIIPFHSSPHDYYRWTREGLAVLLEDFELVELKPTAGPTCALLLVIQDWVSLALSFNIKILKDIIWLVMVLLTFPFKILDFVLIRYERAGDLSAGFYYIGRRGK